MSGHMLYAPAVLRASPELSVSAIYISVSGTEDFALALSGDASKLIGEGHGPELSLESDDENVWWESVQLVGQTEIREVAHSVAELGPQFKLEPAGPSVLMVFRFATPDAGRRREIANKGFSICSELIEKSAVTICSSPFSSINTDLFRGYLTRGILSRTARNTLLLDARYLDGMEGGVVCLQSRDAGNNRTRQDCSIGIVVGSLLKTSGEGRLLLAVPWSVVNLAVARIDGAIMSQLVSAICDAPQSVVSVTQSLNSGVVAVHADLPGNRRAWGSGVLVSQEFVVTNGHVARNSLKLNVLLNKSHIIPVKAVHQPLEGVDLVLLQLETKVPSGFTPVEIADVDPCEGEPVWSSGYGLFYPNANTSQVVDPLYSEGIISATSNDGMLVSSAGCWNGSSGGPVLDTTGHLVGIMASNARDDTTGEVMPDMSFVIPGSVVKRALQLLRQNLTEDVGSRYRTLWQLKQTHRFKSRL